MTYKHILKVVVPVVLALTLLTQCDSITPGNDEVQQIETVTLISPVNSATNQSSEVELQWKRIKGAKTYNIKLSESESFDETIIDEMIEGSSYVAEGLSPDKTYYWKVYPIKRNHSGPWSEVWNFTTAEVEMDPVTVDLMSPEDGVETTAEELVLEWEALGSSADYNYQVAADSEFSELILDSVTDASSIFITEDENIEDLTAGETYSWRVSPILDDGPSDWSEVRTFALMDSENGSGDNENTPPPSGSFVEVQNSNFVIDGEVTRFAGTNAYYLPNYEKLNSGVVDRAFDLFQETGVNVVRMWGFYDGYDCGYSKNDPNENVIQTAPGEYDEEALRDLDRVIAKGKEHGVRFIIPFINYWDELGGICQYNTWAGASNPSQNTEFFINNDQTQEWFRDYIDMLLNRVNTVTGVAYKDEPAIFAWQVMNEGRNSGGDPQLIRDWYQEIAQHIKSIDPNHLVGTGEEGFDEGIPSEYSSEEYSNTYVLRAQQGTSYVMNTAIPEIDFASAHWYPNEWGFGTDITDDLLRAQKAWLGDHQAIAESHGKPFIIGEFGFPGWADDRVEEMYNELYSEVETKQVDGNLLWQLVADGTKCFEFGGNICYPGGREDTVLYNPFKNHVEYMKTL